MHAGQGLTEVWAHEAVVVSCGAGVAESLMGLGKEHILPALRARGEVGSSSQPGGYGVLMSGLEPYDFYIARDGLLSPNHSFLLAFCPGLNSIYPTLKFVLT